MSAPTMDKSTTERSKTVIRRLTDAFNDRDKEALLACYGEAIVCHDHTGPETLSREGMWAAVLTMYEVMPDMRARIVALIAEDDHVVVRWDFEGTQEGELLGFPPSGRRATWARWFDYRLDDAGKIVELWWLSDSLSLLQQLGHVELPVDRETE